MTDFSSPAVGFDLNNTWVFEEQDKAWTPRARRRAGRRARSLLLWACLVSTVVSAAGCRGRRDRAAQEAAAKSAAAKLERAAGAAARRRGRPGPRARPRGSAAPPARGPARRPPRGPRLVSRPRRCPRRAPWPADAPLRARAVRYASTWTASRPT